jgi:hypothetical protein
LKFDCCCLVGFFVQQELKKVVLELEQWDALGGSDDLPHIRNSNVRISCCLEFSYLFICLFAVQFVANVD